MADQNEIEVKITGTTGDLDSDINQVESKVKNAAKGMKESATVIKSAFNDIKNTLKNVEFKIKVDTSDLQTTVQTALSNLRTQMQAAGQSAAIKIRVDSTELANIRNQINSGLSGSNGTIKLKFDRTHLQAEMAQVRARLNSFFASAMNGIRVNVLLAPADITAIRARLSALTSSIFRIRLGIDLAYLNSQIANARAMLGALGSSMRINIDATATGLIAAINSLKVEIVRLISAMNSNGGGGGGSGGGDPTILAGMTGQLAGLFAGYMSLTTAAAGFKKVISSQREFDILNAQLETATKSAEGAKVAFAFLQEFAKKTPYDLKQAVDGFTKLVNLGLTPSERALTSYGNTSAAMGKDLMQMVEAVADATTGEFERLKEFGIKAKQNGDKVSLTFQGVTKTIGNNAAEIEEYLLKLGENEFAGAMAKRVDTLDGAIASLADTWDALFRAVSNLGVGDIIKQSVNDAEDSISSMIKLLQSGAVESALSGMSKAFSIFGNNAKSDMKSIATVFSGLGTYLVSVWRSTISEMNIAGNIWTKVKAGGLLVANAVSSGYEIMADPTNKKSSNSAKQQAYEKRKNEIVDQAINNLDAVKNGFNQADLLREFQRLMDEEEKNRDKPGDPGAQFKITSTGKPASSGASGKKDKKGKKSAANDSAMGKLNADLDIQQNNWEKDQHDAKTLQEFPLEKVKEYWQNVLATKKLSADDQLKVEKNLADANHAIRQRGLNDELAKTRLDLQSYSQNISAKLEKAQSYTERLKTIYGSQSSEYKQALQEQQQLEQDIKQKSYEVSLRESEHNQQIKLNEIEAAEAQMQHEYDLGLMSSKKRLAALRAFEQQRYDITQAGIKERIALYDDENTRTEGRLNPDDRVKMIDQKSASDTDHNKNQKGFDMQSEALKMESMFGGLGDRVSGLWDKGLQSMMDGTLTWRNAMNAVFADMGAFFIQKMVSEPLKQYAAGLARKLAIRLGFVSAETSAEVAGQTAQTGAVVAGEAARTGATILGSGLRMATKVMETIGSIMLSAYEAMAGAWAAMVRIPFVGPVIAPVVAAGAFAGVIGLVGKIKSASGGYDIPSGVNPVTQLHEEEMVLPKPYANVIRDMAAGGGAPPAGGVGGGEVHHHNYNIQAWDSRDMKRFLRDNSSALAGGLKSYGRNFGSK